uniref:Uncharacterized protein n=1 Tax=Zea mays TaxID=4577 RepID=B6TVQ9_MAIZE|nr:hypothetical protein [Zea mays]
MASNKSIALLVLALALMLTVSVHGQLSSSSPTPAPSPAPAAPTPTPSPSPASAPAPTPAPAPSQNRCPPGFPDLKSLLEGIKRYLAQAIYIFYVPSRQNPGNSSNKCLCFPASTSIISIFSGPYECVPAPLK